MKHELVKWKAYLSEKRIYMKNRVILIAACLAVLFTGDVCAQEQKREVKTEISSGDAKKDTGEAAKTTGTYLKQKKERYQKKVEEKLSRIEDDTKKLGEKAEKGGEKAKEKFSKAAEELKMKSREAKNKLAELKNAGEEQWRKVKKELDALLRDLERAYDRAAARIKGNHPGE